MNSNELHVEVFYPQELRIRWTTFCIWHNRPRFDIPLWDQRPNGTAGWVDTFGPFDSLEQAEKFAKYTDEQLTKWPDTCQGEAFAIRSLPDDRINIEGTIGCRK